MAPSSRQDLLSLPQDPFGEQVLRAISIPLWGLTFWSHPIFRVGLPGASWVAITGVIESDIGPWCPTFSWPHFSSYGGHTSGLGHWTGQWSISEMWRGQAETEPQTPMPGTSLPLPPWSATQTPSRTLRTLRPGWDTYLCSPSLPPLVFSVPLLSRGEK